jgi:hypothetical protein
MGYMGIDIFISASKLFNPKWEPPEDKINQEQPFYL